MNLVENIKITPIFDTLRLQKISDAEYFSERYSDYISNSRLGFIDPNNGGSPEKFLAGFKGNRIFSDSLSLGSVVHEQTLQPELFSLCPDLNRPTAKVGFIADEIASMRKGGKLKDFTKEEFYKACSVVDYYKGEPKESKIKEILPAIKEYLANLEVFLQSKPNVSTYLDSKTLDKAKGCISALKNNKKVQSLLHPTGLLETPISECEQAILLDAVVKCPDLPEFTIRLKSKLDNYTIDKESNVITVNDVKTIGRTLNNSDEQVLKYHYYREMSMYCYLLSLCAKQFYGLPEKFKVRSNFLWVSTVPPTGNYTTYATKVTPMTPELFKLGSDEFKDLLRRASVALYFKDAVQVEEYFQSL